MEIQKYTFPLARMIKIPLEIDSHKTEKTDCFYKISDLDKFLKEITKHSYCTCDRWSSGPCLYERLRPLLEMVKND